MSICIYPAGSARPGCLRSRAVGPMVARPIAPFTAMPDLFQILQTPSSSSAFQRVPTASRTSLEHPQGPGLGRFGTDRGLAEGIRRKRTGVGEGMGILFLFSWSFFLFLQATPNPDLFLTYRSQPNFPPVSGLVRKPIAQTGSNRL